MADAELRARAKLEGGAETARGLKEIGDAQGKVTEQGKTGATVAKKLNTSTESYTSLLSRIHPALGAWADGLFKGVKVAGELGQRQVSLRGILTKTTAAIKRNLQALLAFGAVGAVLAGLAAIAAAVRKIREEYDLATKAIDENRRVLTQQSKARQERAERIESTMDRTRREGVAGAGDVRAATTTAERISGKLPGIDEGAIDRVVALTADLDLLFEQIQALAVIEGRLGGARLEEGMPPEVRQSIAQAALRHYGGRVAGILDRERVQAAEIAQEAQKQRTALGGSTYEAEQVAEQFAPAGMEPERLAKLLQRYPTLEELEGHEAGRGVGPGGHSYAVTLTPWKETERTTDAERATLRAILAELQRQTRMREQEASRGGGNNGNVFHNAHVTVVGGRDDVARNGRNDGRDYE
jgi:hypothetical protein